MTRQAEGLPVTMHRPGSLSPGTKVSKGMQRMVAFKQELAEKIDKANRELASIEMPFKTN